ncbi:MAG: hypothetical protein QME60_03440, partial [Verrucomicrobiota bacterium]|nr:hypothetical protein [Verrucomicrobiota bacterium]
ADDKVYTAKLDDNGKKVAKFDGKTVKITGTVDDENVITVIKVAKAREKKGEKKCEKKAVDTAVKEADKKPETEIEME